MSLLGHSGPSHLAPKSCNIGCSPIAAKMLQYREHSEVPRADACTAANGIAIRSLDRRTPGATL